MRILFLSQIVPFPLDAGPKVKTWQVLRYLVGEGHQVTLACFVRAEEEVFLPEVEKLGVRVLPVKMRRSRLKDVLYWLRSLASGRPFLIERDDLPGMRQVVQEQIETGQVDVVHADQFNMAQFALNQGSFQTRQPVPYRILDAHNAVWTIAERMVQTAPVYLRPVIALEARRTRRYEGRLVQAFDHTLAVTEIDRQALLDAVGSLGEEANRAAVQAKISVIPIAVDTHQITPVSRPHGSNTLVTLGTLHYPPNADGIRWFAREVFPLVRQQVSAARLIIIGKNPPADFLQLAEQSNGAATVTGYVPDLTPYLEQAAAVVIPVRAGGGMRVRILEAFARAIPVVTTSVGLEGIEAVPGRDVLVEDAPAEFAGSVVRLMRDPALQTQLAHNSRILAERVYDWQVALKTLAGVYAAAEKRPGAGSPDRLPR